MGSCVGDGSSGCLEDDVRRQEVEVRRDRHGERTLVKLSSRRLLVFRRMTGGRSDDAGE